MLKLKFFIIILFAFNFKIFANGEIDTDADSEIYENTKFSQIENQISDLKIRIDNIETNLKNLLNHVKILEVNQQTNIVGSSVQKYNPQKNYDQEKQDYELALEALKKADYNTAERKFQKFITDYPYSSLLSNIYFWYGEIYFRKEEYENAGIFFLSGYRKFPRGIKASDSLLKLAMTLDKLDKSDETCKIIDKLQTEFKERSLSSKQKEKEMIEKNSCYK